MTSTNPVHPQEPTIRVMMMPRDTNAFGTIFGGVILSEIDLAAAVEAHRWIEQQHQTVVTSDYVLDETLTLLRMTNLSPLAILFGKSTSRLLGALLLLVALYAAAA